ncbi:hypothetical protein H696_03779 [Fonticula alba]|uniref:BZIP domain-containing protein n=1 Tax=Fonticula alba TaxID=691883 RepID=A0A058Z743_FONAL|nr:hypothetical protein H696_03779 [Fonticula alba]KCV69347.1 hypothetical protein H696_03779 [Fonticula alba]|eukprot:XP_009495912.1 hypothetical protein H696_03779 [Fonticula alba]
MSTSAALPTVVPPSPIHGGAWADESQYSYYQQQASAPARSGHSYSHPTQQPPYQASMHPGHYAPEYPAMSEPDMASVPSVPQLLPSVPASPVPGAGAYAIGTPGPAPEYPNYYAGPAADHHPAAPPAQYPHQPGQQYSQHMMGHYSPPAPGHYPQQHPYAGGSSYSELGTGIASPFNLPMPENPVSSGADAKATLPSQSYPHSHQSSTPQQPPPHPSQPSYPPPPAAGTGGHYALMTPSSYESDSSFAPAGSSPGSYFSSDESPRASAPAPSQGYTTQTYFPPSAAPNAMHDPSEGAYYGGSPSAGHSYGSPSSSDVSGHPGSGHMSASPGHSPPAGHFSPATGVALTPLLPSVPPSLPPIPLPAHLMVGPHRVSIPPKGPAPAATVPGAEPIPAAAPSSSDAWHPVAPGPAPAGQQHSLPPAAGSAASGSPPSGSDSPSGSSPPTPSLGQGAGRSSSLSPPAAAGSISSSTAELVADAVVAAIRVVSGAGGIGGPGAGGPRGALPLLQAKKASDRVLSTGGGSGSAPTPISSAAVSDPATLRRLRNRASAEASRARKAEATARAARESAARATRIAELLADLAAARQRIQDLEAECASLRAAACPGGPGCRAAVGPAPGPLPGPMARGGAPPRAEYAPAAEAAAALSGAPSAAAPPSAVPRMGTLPEDLHSTASDDGSSSASGLSSSSSMSPESDGYFSGWKQGFYVVSLFAFASLLLPWAGNLSSGPGGVPGAPAGMLASLPANTLASGGPGRGDVSAVMPYRPGPLPLDPRVNAPHRPSAKLLPGHPADDADAALANSVYGSPGAGITAYDTMQSYLSAFQANLSEPLLCDQGCVCSAACVELIQQGLPTPLGSIGPGPSGSMALGIPEGGPGSLVGGLTLSAAGEQLATDLFLGASGLDAAMATLPGNASDVAGGRSLALPAPPGTRALALPGLAAASTGSLPPQPATGGASFGRPHAALSMTELFGWFAGRNMSAEMGTDGQVGANGLWASFTSSLPATGADNPPAHVLSLVNGQQPTGMPSNEGPTTTTPACARPTIYAVAPAGGLTFVPIQPSGTGQAPGGSQTTPEDLLMAGDLHAPSVDAFFSTPDGEERMDDGDGTAPRGRQLVPLVHSSAGPGASGVSPGPPMMKFLFNDHAGVFEFECQLHSIRAFPHQNASSTSPGLHHFHALNHQ